MTGFGVLVGLWLVSLSIDRFTDKFCECLSDITLKIKSETAAKELR